MCAGVLYGQELEEVLNGGRGEDGKEVRVY